jgi:hypothetical protein
MQCKYSHDHETAYVAIPTNPGRKFHCPDKVSPSKHRTGWVRTRHSGNHLEGGWRLGTLNDALKLDIPACQLCFSMDSAR